MKDVQCYELFGGIALKNHAFHFKYAALGRRFIYQAVVGAMAKSRIQFVKLAKGFQGQRNGDFLYHKVSLAILRECLSHFSAITWRAIINVLYINLFGLVRNY